MTQQNKTKDEKEISLGNLFGGKIELQEIDEILTRQVIKFGNSGRINIPAKHIGKEVQVTIWKQDKKEGESKQ